MLNLNQILYSVYNEYADLDILVAKGESWKYSQLLGTAIQLSQQLSGNDPVAIMTNSDFAAYSSIFAAVFAGKPYVFLNNDFPTDRIVSILTASNAKDLIADEGLMHLIPPNIKDQFNVIPTSGVTAAEKKYPAPAQVPSDRLVYLMFTSGTTGKAKGVPISRSNLEAYVENVTSIIPISPGDRCTRIPSLAFDLSVHDIFATIVQGGCMYTLEPNDRLDPVGFVNRHQINCWVSVPSVAIFADKLGVLAPGAMPSLKQSIFCGEPMSAKIAKRWAAACPNGTLWNLYGPTEATVAITAFRFDERYDYSDFPSLPIGRPFPGQNLQICQGVDEKYGELELSGSQVCKGYLNEDALEAEKFYKRDNTIWYRTGDLVEYNERWGYVFHGRLDHQIKIGGYRVEIGEIEKAISDISGSTEVVVVPDPVSDEGIIMGVKAFICATQMNGVDILKEIRKRIPVYMTPHTIEKIDKLPYTTNGKVDRNALMRRK